MVNVFHAKIKRRGVKNIGKQKYNFEEEKFLEDYRKLRSSRKMAELYGCDKGTILNYAKKIGHHNTKSCKLNDEEKQEIVRLYDTKTSTELADHYDVSRGQITKIWYDNNLIGKNRNKYPFNYNYFENIDTNDKAYFLGFLAADGNVHIRNNNSSQAIIRLSLKSEDEKILEIFKLYLNSDQPLYTFIKENNSYITYIKCLELVSNKMADDLKKYNITKRKTYDYEIKILNKKLMPHFFRGYFDGDGCITCNNNKFHTPSSYYVSICGFVHNLDKMKTYLKDEENIDSLITYDNRHNGKLKFGSLYFANLEQQYKFLKYIYNNKEDTFLPRKNYLSECFFNAISKNYSNRQNIYNSISNCNMLP